MLPVGEGYFQMLKLFQFVVVVVVVGVRALVSIGDIENFQALFFAVLQIPPLSKIRPLPIRTGFVVVLNRAHRPWFLP